MEPPEKGTRILMTDPCSVKQDTDLFMKQLALYFHSATTNGYMLLKPHFGASRTPTTGHSPSSEWLQEWPLSVPRL